MTVGFLRRKLNEYSTKSMRSMIDTDKFIDWLEQYAHCQKDKKKDKKTVSKRA